MVESRIRCRTNKQIRRSRLRASLENLERRDNPAPFTPGNLVIYRVGDGAAALTSSGTAVFLDEYSTSGTLVQSIMLPNGSLPALVANGTSTSEGQLAVSPDGQFLTLVGYNAVVGTTPLQSATSAAVNRMAAIVDFQGNIDLSTSLNDYASAGSPRAGITTDGTNIWVSGSTGGARFTTKGSTTSTQLSTTTTNLRGLNIYNSQLFVSAQSGATRVATVGVGLPTTSGQTITNLPGADIAALGSPYAFFAADLTASVPGLDTIYVADDGSGTGFRKFSLVGGSWVANGNISVTGNGLRGITGVSNGSSVTLYGSSPASMFTLTDTSGYNAPISGSVTALAASGTNTAFRGIAFVPQAAAKNATVTSITAPVTQTSGSSVTFTSTFSAAVNNLQASNFTLTTTGTVTGTIGTPSGGGNNWTIPVTGLTGFGTIRLDFTDPTGVTPPILNSPFTSGTTVTVAPVSATLDVSGSNTIFAAGLGKTNNVSVSAGSVTITDSLETITLTAAAKTAGWTGDGTNTVTAPTVAVSNLIISLGDGADTFTLNTLAVPVTALSAGASGSNAQFPNNLTFAGNLSVTGFETIAQSAGKLLAVTNLTFAGGTIGSSGTPIHTKATSISASAGSGGLFLLEDDGADFTLSATGAGPISVTNTTGTLNVAGASNFGSGAVSLSSGDGVAINAAFGDLFATGTFAVAANTNGAGSEGFIVGPLGSIKSSSVDPGAAFALTVNTAGGGTGDATVGNITIGSTGTMTIDVNNGSVVYAGNGPIIAGGGLNTFPGTLNIKTSGAASAVGAVGNLLQFRTGNFSVNSGSGGIFMEETSDQNAKITSATATGAGDIFFSAPSVGNNGFVITGPVTTVSGNITIRTDDDLRIQAGGSVGDANFKGKILFDTSLDGQNQQGFFQDSGTTVQTTNKSADAIVINASPSTNAGGIGGATLANIITGAGGGLTVDVAFKLGNSTDANRAGIIQMADNFSTLDVGPSGTITLTAKDNGIGSSAIPIKAIAGTVAANTTTTDSIVNALQGEGDIFVTAVGPTAFSGSTTSKAPRVGDITFSTTSGAMSLNGDVMTDDGSINLVSVADLTQTAGKVVTTGPLNLTYFGTATFATAGNSAGSVNLFPAQKLQVDGSLTSATPITIDGVLAGSGTVSDVNITATGKVTPGTSPGKLSTGNIAFVGGSQFVVELNGIVAGTGYDQLNVVGAVDLGSTTLVGSLGFVPPSGQKFTIIDNDGVDPVIGTFNGLGEGAKVNIGGTDFTLTYKGGSGNDVVLTAPGTAAPAAKITSIAVNGSGVQRSMFTSLVIGFDTAVSFVGAASAAFTLQNQGTTNFATLNAVLDGTAKVATLTFTGGSVDLGGSLSDGRYTLTVLANQFAGNGFDGNGDGTAGDNYVEIGSPTVTPAAPNKLFRFFGDADGNGQVNTVDFNAFRAAFGGSSTIFDYDGLGGVTTLDFNQFRSRFGGSI